MPCGMRREGGLNERESGRAGDGGAAAGGGELGVPGSGRAAGVDR